MRCFIQRLHVLLAAAAVAAAPLTSGLAQSEWPEEYQQYGDPRASSPQAPNLAPTVLNPSFRPFECEAPISNYQQKRDTAEVEACLNAHMPIFNAIYALYPTGVGHSGDLKWGVNINPRGTVSFATPGGSGKPATTYLQAMSLMIKHIHFGACNPCRSETIYYTIRTAR